MDLKWIKKELKECDFKSIVCSISPLVCMDRDIIFEFEDFLLEKIYDYDLWSITVGLDILSSLEKRTSIKILEKVKESINSEIILSKIENESSPFVIYACLGHLAGIILSDENAGNKLFKILSQKLNKPGVSPGLVISCILKIAVENEIGKKTANDITNSIDLTLFQSKLKNHISLVSA